MTSGDPGGLHTDRPTTLEAFVPQLRVLALSVDGHVAGPDQDQCAGATASAGVAHVRLPLGGSRG